MIATRRNFLRGLGTLLIAAPAIVRIGSIMPVKAMPVEDIDEAMSFIFRTSLQQAWREISLGQPFLKHQVIGA